MLTHTWLPGQTNDRLFEATFSVERDLGASMDVFLEYVGDYPSSSRPEPSPSSRAGANRQGGAPSLADAEKEDFETHFREPKCSRILTCVLG
jgi:hypothetical protein